MGTLTSNRASKGSESTVTLRYRECFEQAFVELTPMKYKAWIGIGDDFNWGISGFRVRSEALINPMLVDPTWWTYNMCEAYKEVTNGGRTSWFSDYPLWLREPFGTSYMV